MSPKTLSGAELELDDAPARECELFLVDGNNLAYRAFFALPEELATSEGFPTGRAARVHEHAVQAALRLPAQGGRSGVGHAARAPGGALRRVQAGPPADAGSPPGAVPVLPPDRRGVRLPQPRVRGLGSRRRDRHARHPGGRGRDPDMRRLDRPRCLPARHRQRLPDDDPARRRGCERLHARARRGEARDHGRQGARLHRPEGRSLRQHRRRPGNRRQDRVAADRRLRLARGSPRARGRADPGAPEGDRRARRPGAQLQGAGDDAARPGHRLRPRRTRARAARPLAARGDVPPFRVPRAAAARRPAGRGPPGRGPAGRRGRSAPLARGRRRK